MTLRGRVEGGQVVTEPSELLPEGAEVSIEVFIPAPSAAADSRSLAGIESDSGTRTDFMGSSISSDALRFCREKGLLLELSRAIDIAKNCFSIIGNPAVDLVRDRETNGLSYLSLEIRVSGAVKDNVIAHRKFAQEAARLLGSNREMITLHYDIV
jgi:hypothetical protein